MDYEEIYKKTRGRMPPQDQQLLEKTATEIEAKTILEIGSAAGGSSVILGSVAKNFNGHLYCIDPRPEGGWQLNIDYYGLTNYVTMFRVPSPWVNMKKIKFPIDFLFIDGNHRTRWLLVDYHFFFPFVRVGGRIAFHDICGKNNCYANWVRRGIDIIMEDDSDKLKEVGRVESKKGGVLVLEKISDILPNPEYSRIIKGRDFLKDVEL